MPGFLYQGRIENIITPHIPPAIFKKSQFFLHRQKSHKKNLTSHYNTCRKGKYNNMVLHQTLLNVYGHICITTIIG